MLVALTVVLSACEASMRVPASAVGSGSTSGAGSSGGSGSSGKSGSKVEAPKAPPPLAGGQAKPYGIAVDNDSVYWGNHGDFSLMKAPKAGGAAVKLGTVAGNLGPDAVVVDDQFVYASVWSDSGTPDEKKSKIVKVAKAGGAVTDVVANIASTSSIAVDGTHVYWVDQTSAGIMRTAKAGGPPQKVVDGYVQIESVSVDDTNVYFAGSKGTKIPIVKAPKAGGAATELAPTSNARVVTVDADNVYFLMNDKGGDLAIHKVPKAGGAAALLGKAKDGAMVLTFVAGTVYGSHRGKTDIWKLPASGGDAVDVVGIKPGARAIAVDDASVYWTDGVATVNKAPR